VRHDYFVQLVNSIVDELLKPGSKTEAREATVAQQVDGLECVSIDEAAFLRFLEDIELLVGSAVALWPRAAAGEMRLSTASTRLCFLPFVETSFPLLIQTFLL
jgi:hypothetical protein